MNISIKPLIVTAGLAVTLAVSAAALPGPASAAPSRLPVAQAETCHAFTTWMRHRTNGNLDAMMAKSFATPWKYIGEDAAGLYGDVRSGAKAKYVNADIRYFEQDCNA